MKGDAYTCAHCGRTYGKTYSDSVALAEYAARFPDGPEQVETVCDGCYQAYLARAAARR